jgi:hypothetical protein
MKMIVHRGCGGEVFAKIKQVENSSVTASGDCLEPNYEWTKCIESDVAFFCDKCGEEIASDEGTEWEEIPDQSA